jgi:hypothetical protein
VSTYDFPNVVVAYQLSRKQKGVHSGEDSLTGLRSLNSSSAFLLFAILKEIRGDPPPIQHEMNGSQQYQEYTSADMQALEKIPFRY